MAETTKTRVIDIKTGPSEKGVKSLKQQIKELREQLSQLEKGTAEYNKVSKQLADANQKNIEVTEAMKYSNKDFGQTMSNLTSVSLGLVGGFNALSASMALIGGDSEDMQKALVPIQLIMASIQGFTQMDKALKALTGLKNAFTEIGDTSDGIKGVGEALETVSKASDASGVESIAEATSTLAKTEAQATTGAVALNTAESTLNKTTKVGVVTTKGLTSGLKKAALAMKSFIASNPILLAISVAIGAVAAGISALNKHLEEEGRVAKEERDIMSDVNGQYEEQNVRLNVLLNTAKDHNESLEERKKAVEELNKIVPDYNGNINEETGLLEANNKAMETYLNNLQQRLQLEAYESKIKEYMEQKVELEKEINDLEETGWWRVKARVADRKNEIKQLDNDIQRIYGNIKNLDLSSALNENKVVTKKSGVTQQIKLIVDAIKEAKKEAQDFWELFYNAKGVERKAKGPYGDFAEYLDNIEKAFGKYDFFDRVYDEADRVKLVLKDVFTDSFADFLANGFQSNFFEVFTDGFSASDIFKQPDQIKKVKKEAQGYATQLYLISQYYQDIAKKQGGKLTAAQTKEFEDRKKQYEVIYNSLQKQVEGYEAIIQYTYDYGEIVRGQREEENQKNIMLEKRNKLLEIESQYTKDIRRNNPLSDINKTISTEELEYEMMKKNNEEMRKKILFLETASNVNGLYKDELIELDKQIQQSDRDLADKEIEIDKYKYERRTQLLKAYREEYEKETAKMYADLENEKTLKGGGTADYNLGMDRLMVQKQNLDYMKDMIDSYHQQGLIDEQEYQDRLLALQSEYDALDIEMTKAKVDRKLAIHNAYYNALSSLASNVGSILDEEMSKYDENSEQYRTLAVSKGWIDTLSGSLSAFMSGFQSGIPFPWNLALAGALAGTTLTTGIMQINKIKSGSTSSSLSTGAVNVGSYETTAYETNAELMGNIKDQKVVVLESDISTAQRNVNVREANSRF